MAGHAAQDDEVGQSIDDIDGLEFSIDADRQTFMGKLVDDIEHAILPSLVGAVLDKVIAGMVYPKDEVYFAEKIKPLMSQSRVEFVGEIDDRTKTTFLGEALALLFPVGKKINSDHRLNLRIARPQATR